MNDHQAPPNMSQKIFQMGLAVETVSVYLLCYGLAASGTPLSLEDLKTVWNGTPAQLEDGLKTLEKRNILTRLDSGSGELTLYRLVDADRWKCH